MMDRVVQKKKSFRILYFGSFVVFFILLACYSIFSYSPSARMDKDDVEIKMVQKGGFNVYVVGNGAVVPRDVDYVTARTDGELVIANVKSGDVVEKDQTLFVVKNEELIADYENSKIAVAEANDALSTGVFELETRRLEIEVNTLKAKSEYMVQAEEYKAYQNLLQKPNASVSKVLFRQSEIRESQFKKIYQLEKIRLRNFERSMKTQLNQLRARVSLAENALERVNNRVKDLKLKAKVDGIVQDVDFKVGQRVEAGTVIGMVSNPNDVYVRLKVSAVQGHRLTLGQHALVSIRNEDRKGVVVRIDPNVRGTTIDVDIDLQDESKLPINMFVGGKIIIEELRDALFVDVPLTGVVENGISSFYRVSEDGTYAQLKKVDTGFMSAGKVQVRGNLSVGDRIVVSDTGKFVGIERVSLH